MRGIGSVELEALMWNGYKLLEPSFDGNPYGLGFLTRIIHSLRPSWRQRVHGEPKIDASQRTLRRWHQEHAVGALLVRRSILMPSVYY